MQTRDAFASDQKQNAPLVVISLQLSVNIIYINSSSNLVLILCTSSVFVQIFSTMAHLFRRQATQTMARLSIRYVILAYQIKEWIAHLQIVLSRLLHTNCADKARSMHSVPVSCPGLSKLRAMTVCKGSSLPAIQAENTGIRIGDECVVSVYKSL